MTQPQDLVGKKLGDYIILDQLTSGGMAHIFIGEDQKLRRKAAIKVLTSDMSGKDALLRERFEREARAIANLEHDNIVPIYQFGEQDNLYFIAMRYIEGKDLADEMKFFKERNQKMPVDRALRILEQVAAALDYAHRRGIIHRDVKPSNVLLGSEDKAVLSDFGLVLWEDVDKTLGTAFGTPRYISPEQATDSQSALPQSDIYSLAVIVYEILTGEMLFKGATPMEVALAHITEQPRPPRAYNPEIPRAAEQEILRSLQKDPNKRHRSATDFIVALREAYDYEPKTDPIKKGKKLADPDTSTIPLKPDTPAAKPVIPSPRATMASWDDLPTTQQDTVTPGAAAPPRKLPVPLLIVGAAFVLTVALFAFNLVGGGSDEHGMMQIRYNENYFAIINTAENVRMNISSLGMYGVSGEQGVNFGSVLEPGACVFVHRSNVPAANVPREWGCSAPARRVESSDALYWRAEDANDRTFSVRDGSRVLNTCNTFGRAVNNLQETICEVNWTNTIPIIPEG